ncbi:SCO1431 family membrane protein [Streptomyces yaizuensis]|uniref:SCO1431 family membrane protein n=1 Tax=Streptomyces yaizuensis TaxID=2989713 RepID=A0ABQ5P1Y1_9ACTN|nr:SCO1431 family membrane protein [Streptomyces sp. YSPA8]GLF96443.1 SCO1431 family membrane protein [Streptomyces sp. YSPA8]
MTTTALPPAATRTRTGGPDDDRRSELVEHLAGWALVVVIAMLVTRLGLL